MRVNHYKVNKGTAEQWQGKVETDVPGMQRPKVAWRRAALPPRSSAVGPEPGKQQDGDEQRTQLEVRPGGGAGARGRQSTEPHLLLLLPR